MKTTMKLALVFAAFWAGAAVAARRHGRIGNAGEAVRFPARERPAVGLLVLAQQQHHAGSSHGRLGGDATGRHRRRADHGRERRAPPSPMAFAGPQWRAMFKHVCREAARLGLEVNMYNCAGFTSSGGPWITPELSMQKIVWTETSLAGPRRAELALAQPEKVAGYYRDIAVVAFPTPAGQARIEDVKGKTLLERHDFPASPAAYRTLPAEQTIPGEKIVELTAHFKDGRLTWDVPPGRWTVLRFGHTSTGAVNLPPPKSGAGLECDKLSAEAADAMFAGLMAKLVDDNRPLVGKTLVATHIDSWEVDSQNWTARLFDEFQKRRRYDPRRYWPALAGRVVDSLEASERFLWDFRQTIAELFLETYPGRFRELARKHGLRLTDRSLWQRTVRGSVLRRPGRRADGRVLVLRHGHAQLRDRDDLRRPRLRQADRRRRSLHRAGHREMARPSGQHQDPGRLGVLRRDQSLRLPSLRHAAAAHCAGRGCWPGPGHCTTSGRRPGGSSRRRGTSTSPAASSCCARGCSSRTFVLSSRKGRRGASRRRSRGPAIRPTAPATTSTSVRPRPS